MSHFISRVCPALLFLSFCSLVSCRAIETVDKVEKSTAEVGDKMDKTNDGIDRTNRKMDETNGNIGETNQKMDDVRRQMNEMNEKLLDTNKRMEGMNRALDRMYQDLRQGDALNARLKTIENLVGTPSLKGKTVFAAQYFMSFEYQLWKGEGVDNDPLRQVLLRTAVEELVHVLRRLAHSDFSVDVLATDNDLISLQALSLSLHMLNPNAEYDLRSKNISVYSMHDLLRNSLQYGYDLQNGKIIAEDLPEYAQLALRDPALTRYLFDLRAAMFPALVVSELSDVSSDEVVSRWTSRAGVWLKPWTARTENLNELQVRQLSDWIKLANADVAFLKSIGVQPKTDASLLRILSNMKIVDSGAERMSSVAGAAKRRALSGLKSQVEQYLSQVNLQSVQPR